MACSPDRDKDTSPNDKQSKPDNPFIKFRQFADTQISSFLQGIIGLPSAFSKRSSDDPRWAGVDDGLRRRDELQARQKDLKESEARKLHREASDEEEPFTRTVDRTYFPGEGYRPLGERDCQHGTPTKDLPLYSAVKKSLFAHLEQPDFDEADWNDLKTPPIWGGNGFLLRFYPLKLRPDQMHTYFAQDAMEMTHCLVYNELNSSSSFRSEYSLLPYLLFSPYSPLNLESDFCDGPALPYCDAFEDLIAKSQPPTEGSPWKYMMSRMIGTPVGSPEANMSWVVKLQSLGYLQEKKHTGEDYRKTLDYQLLLTLLDRRNKSRLFMASYEDDVPSPNADKPSVANSARAPMDIEDDLGAKSSPRTEQEMYDHFLKWASSPQAIKEVFEAGEAFLSSLKNDDMSGGRREQDDGPFAPSSLMKEILEVTKAFRELSQPWDISSKPEQDDRISPEAKPSGSPDRVVSSSTTTEQTVHEDGTVETSVTVWKKFSSGRETSTITHHCDDPAVPDNTQSEQDGLGFKGSENTKNESEKGKKNEKSGWFWN